jgi:hypothetical protein
MTVNEIQPLQPHFREIWFNLVFNILVVYPRDIRKYSYA